MRLPLASLILLAATAGAAAQGAPKSIDDCERIKVDLAYNQCLAAFGPRMGERAARIATPPDEGEDAATSTAPARRGVVVQRGKGGRKSASFTIGPRSDSAPQQSRRSRRR